MQQKNVNRFVIGLFLMIALVGIASANINNFYIVVTDASNNPISGASVTLAVPGYSSTTRTTGSDGRSTMTGYTVSSPCSATITITKSGYTTYSSTDSFMEKSSTPGNTYDYYYQISTPQVTNIQVKVEDSVNHAILPGATVSIPEGTPSTSTTDSTGKTGVISVPSTAAGYHVTITKSGYTSYSTTDAVYYSATTQVMTYRPTAIVTPTPTPDPVHANVRYTIQDASTSAVITDYAITIRDNTNAVLESGAVSSITPYHYYYFSPIPSSYSIEISKSGYQTYTHTYSSAPVDGSYVTISLSASTTPTPTTPPTGSYISSMTGLTTVNAGYPTFSACFDGITTTYATYSTDENNWALGYEFASAVNVNKIRFYTYASAERVRHGLVEKWTGSAWSKVPVTSVSDIAVMSGADEFEVSNTDGWSTIMFSSTSATKFRVRFTSSWNVGDANAPISEILMYAPTEATPTPTPTTTQPPVTPSATNIQVQVEDSVNHVIIPGATVSIPEGSPSTSITDATGKTGVIIVPSTAAGYHVTITSSGYNTYTVSDVTVYSATTQTLTHRLTAIVAPTPTPEPVHADVRFTIRDAVTSEIITGYTITIRDNTNAVIEASGPDITTTPYHYHYFSPIPSSWSVEISKSGYETYTEAIAAEPVDGAFKTIYLSSHALTFNVDIKSADTGYLIQGAHIGIYDPVHQVWRNSTAPTGMVYYDSTGANYEYPLSIGQTVKIAAWADDYYAVSQDVTILSDQYLVTMNLPQSSSAPTTGSYTVVFTVVSNLNQQPIKGVTVTSGLGSIKLTNNGGAATFNSVPIGASKWFEFTVSGYQATQVSVNGVDGQVIMQTVEMVPAGATPTPTPTTNVNAAKAADLNVKGQTFATNWADMAIGSGGIIFLMGIVWFARKIQK